MDRYEKQQLMEKQLYNKQHSEDFDSTYSDDLSSLKDEDDYVESDY